MLFTNITQFAVLLLMLVIGWLFGFASHPGAKKWKRAYREEQAARTREVAERDATIRDLETRNTALTRERETSVPAAPVAAAPVAATAATAAARPGRKRGWFDWGGSDDLTRLRGVDAELARLFKREGLERYADLAALSDQDVLALERRIDLPAGYVAREQLREQARALADGTTDAAARSR